MDGAKSDSDSSDASSVAAVASDQSDSINEAPMDVSLSEGYGEIETTMKKSRSFNKIRRGIGHPDKADSFRELMNDIKQGDDQRIRSQEQPILDCVSSDGAEGAASVNSDLRSEWGDDGDNLAALVNANANVENEDDAAIDVFDEYDFDIVPYYHADRTQEEQPFGIGLTEE